VLVCVNCETDFVAKNADFAAMAERMTADRLGEGYQQLGSSERRCLSIATA
jgi:translation elongation factor EF-Ts